MASKKTAGSETTAGKKTAPLDPKVADKLLDLLSTDNEFRRLFKKDPLSALIKVGYKPSKQELALGKHNGPPFTPPGPPTAIPPVWGCMKVEYIASKADIVKARTELKHMLVTGLAQNPPTLDSSPATRARRALK